MVVIHDPHHQPLQCHSHHLTDNKCKFSEINSGSLSTTCSPPTPTVNSPHCDPHETGSCNEHQRPMPSTPSSTTTSIQTLYAFSQNTSTSRYRNTFDSTAITNGYEFHSCSDLHPPSRMQSKEPRFARGDDLDAVATDCESVTSLSSSSLLSLQSQSCNGNNSNLRVCDLPLLSGSHRKYEYCRKCLLQFANRTELYAHIRDYHWSRFKCKICCAQFANEQLLKKHIGNTHDEQHSQCSEPHKCRFCGKAFANRKYLSKHINNIHVRKGNQGKKRCDVCSKWYADNTRLRIHQRIHSGEKPFQCQVCMKAFSDKSAFRKHVQRHEQKHWKRKARHNESEQCDLCDAQFEDEQDLQQHIVRFHGGIIVNIEND